MNKEKNPVQVIEDISFGLGGIDAEPIKVSPPPPLPPKPLPKKKVGSSLPQAVPPSGLAAKIKIAKGYLTSRVFGKRIEEELGITVHNANLDRKSEKEIDEMIESFRDMIKRGYKQEVIDYFFTEGLGFAEMAAVKLFKIHEMEGFSDAVKDNISEFDEELEEISLEMSDSWVPDAKVRLVGKLFKMAKWYAQAGKYQKTEEESEEEEENDEKTDPRVHKRNPSRADSGRVLDKSF